MFDEMERLCASALLRQLLDHYARLGMAERESWQDRLMEMDGTSAEELVKLHGELLAYEWIEQNVGVTPMLQRGRVPRCYRITLTGLRALRWAQNQSNSGDRDEDEAA